MSPPLYATTRSGIRSAVIVRPRCSTLVVPPIEPVSAAAAKTHHWSMPRSKRFHTAVAPAMASATRHTSTPT